MKKLMQNKKPDFDKTRGEELEVDNESMSDVEKENAYLKVKIVKERFSWIFILIFVINLFTFYAYTNILAPLCILLLELIFLFYIADVWGIKSFKTIVYYMIHILGIYKK